MPISTLAGLALPCYSGDVKDMLSRVLQLLVVRDTASTLMKIAQFFHLLQALMARCRTSFPHPWHHKTDEKWGNLPWSQIRGWLTYTCTERNDSNVSWRGAKPAGNQGKFSCFSNRRVSSSGILPCSQLHGWLSHTSCNRLGSILLPWHDTVPLLGVAVDGGQG